MNKKLLVVLVLLAVATAFEYQLMAGPIIEEVNTKQTLWKAGKNAYFDGKTWEDIKGLMGSLPEPEWMQLPPKVEANLENVEALPTDFDSRKQWGNCQSIKEVRDQSNCGSCWAFGAVEAMSDRICIASGQTDQFRVSSENLLSCCGFTCGMGCNGGYTSSAWSYWKNHGLVSGNLHGQNQWCQPYFLPGCDHHVEGSSNPCPSQIAATPTCEKKCNSQFTGKTYDSDIRKGASVYSVRGVQNIMNEIYTHGPVEASFTVYEDFLNYKSGVYEHVSGRAAGGHAVKIIGWGVEGGVDYWLVVNSWNTAWGDHGLFKIKKGHNECGIEGGIVAGIPEKH